MSGFGTGYQCCFSSCCQTKKSSCEKQHGDVQEHVGDSHPCSYWSCGWHHQYWWFPCCFRYDNFHNPVVLSHALTNFHHFPTGSQWKMRLCCQCVSLPLMEVFYEHFMNILWTCLLLIVQIFPGPDISWNSCRYC